MLQRIGSYGTSKNNFANSAKSCKELDALTGKPMHNYFVVP